MGTGDGASQQTREDEAWPEVSGLQRGGWSGRVVRPKGGAALRAGDAGRLRDGQSPAPSGQTRQGQPRQADGVGREARGESGVTSALCPSLWEGSTLEP